MTQLLVTPTRNTIYSATLIDHVFQNQFFANPDCGILDAGFTGHCAAFVKSPFICKENDSTETTYKVFHSIFDENARYVFFGKTSKRTKNDQSL